MKKEQTYKAALSPVIRGHGFPFAKRRVWVLPGGLSSGYFICLMLFLLPFSFCAVAKASCLYKERTTIQSGAGQSTHPASSVQVKKNIWVDQLRCDQRPPALNLENSRPELGWQIKTVQSLQNVMQTAYQVQVASSKALLLAGKADLWDSHKVVSDKQLHVIYQGQSLKSFQQAYWRVRIWTTKGPSSWSQPGHWRMGMLRPSDRLGSWIGWDAPFSWDKVQKFPVLSARYLRKAFTTTKKVQSAVAYVSGLGLYELHINGAKASDAVLAPAPTDYTKTVLYNAIDVTNLLKTGENVIGVLLGSGRYFAMRQHYKPWKWRNFGFPKLYFQLRIEYTDGTHRNVVSDTSWQLSAKGPIRNNNEYDGETYDSRMELPGWDRPGYQPPKGIWQKARIVSAPTGKWTAQSNPLMKVMQQIKPVAVTAAADGGFILDMGQNMAGWVHMQLEGKGHRGDSVRLRFAESVVEATGGKFSLYTANLRDARSTDCYIIKGSEKEDWRPRFTYHGFRYVEVKGYPVKENFSPSNSAKWDRQQKQLLQNFTAEVIYDELPTVGQFSCSDSTINQIYKNALWGICSNYKGMPVDCPQRNERQPWLGDRGTGAYGESFAFKNQLLYDKWLRDIQDAQLVTGSIPDVAPNFWLYYKDDVSWPSTYLSVTDMLYGQYGDLRVIEKHYASMKFWIEYMHHKYVRDGLIHKDSYGDWCVPPDDLQMIHSKNPAKITDGTLIATAMFYHDLQLMTKFALLVGAPEDSSFYQPIAVKMRSAFHEAFYHADSGYYGNNTVTANLLPLAFGLVNKSDEQRVVSRIVMKTHQVYGDHISSGVIGLQYLLRTLSRFGHNDLAVKVAAQRTYPSWGYMVAQGATTIWELFNGNTADPSMNSQNHVMLLGDLLVWLFENQAGIKSDPVQTGFKKIQLAPLIKGPMQYVKASYESDYGLIESHWRKKGNHWIWHVAIPAGTQAVLHFPAGLKNITQNGTLLKKNEQNKAGRLFQIGSGHYVFSGVLSEATNKNKHKSLKQ